MLGLTLDSTQVVGSQRHGMGQNQSLLCRNNIYDEIKDNSKARLGPRKESVVTLDIKINDLDQTDRTRKDEAENSEWSDDPPTRPQESWLGDSGWDQQKSRRREEILYNIFMYESRESQEAPISNINYRRKSSEPKYGRLTSLDVSTLALEQPNNKDNHHF